MALQIRFRIIKANELWSELTDVSARTQTLVVTSMICRLKQAVIVFSNSNQISSGYFDPVHIAFVYVIHTNNFQSSLTDISA